MYKNLLYKTSNKEYKEKYKKLVLFCEKYNAKIIKFDYYKKMFGNFVIVIEYKEKHHEIITDKGDIIFNGKYVCDSSYLNTGQNIFNKLLEIIEENLFNK